MITRQDLLEAIAECNGVQHPNAQTCMMLAAYYTILDHMDRQTVDQPPTYVQGYSYEPPPVENVSYDSKTDFAQTVHGKNTDDVLAIMDELMTTLQVLHPRLYDGVMMKIAD